MRILLHAGRDLSRPGGIETHVRQLAARLADRGHAVEIFGRPAVLPPFRMVDRVDPARYDLIHHHGESWPRGLDAGGRYVKTLHLCVAAKMEVYVRIGRLKTLANPGNLRAVAEERAACRRPGRLIAVAERVRRDFARWHGLDPARARVISNGAPFHAPAETRPALRARHGLPPAAPILLTIGRDDYVKGHRLLARAWERVRGAERGAVWVTAGGRTPHRAPGRLVTGPIPHEEVVSWIHAADFGALPSYYEGCSLALLEMLAGDLFTFSHDVGNAAEVIREGENGAILERSADAWATAIGAALDRPPPRPARGLPPEYAWEAVAVAVEGVYREVLNGPR